jgi:hypothetical protein
MRQKRYTVLTSAKLTGLLEPFFMAVRCLRQAAEQVLDAGARAFWTRFARLSQEAKRQVRERWRLGSGNVPVWDRGSFKVLSCLRPRRRRVRDEATGERCLVYASELDRFRALYRGLVNGDFHQAVMVAAYYC